MELIDIRCTDCLGTHGLPSLEDESVDFTFTDPPYNVAYKSRRRRNAFQPIANDDMPEDVFVEWMSRVSAQLWRVHRPNSTALVCCGWSTMNLFRVAFRQWTLKSTVVWVKESPGLGWHTRSQHEFILLMHKGKPKPPKPAPSDVWQFKRVRRLRHPTEKPLALAEKALQLYTLPGDLVCDPFLGSGTTAEASFKAGRRFVGFELDEQYIAIARARVQQNTGL